MSRIVKAVLKGLRASQPFNWIATSSVRTVLNGLGVQSEFAIKHLHRMGTVLSKLPNGEVLRLWSRGDDWISNQVFWRGWHGYESETTSLFYQCAAQAAVTFDVGAHVGFFSLLAAHANPRGKVYAFEPLPTVYQRLIENVARNGLANVECHSSAVGESDGTADFFHVDTPIPSSSSLSFDFMKAGREVNELRRLTVPVITLDRFVRDRGIGRVDLVKIDTESTEPQVLRGMTEILRRDHPTLFCEVLQGRGSERALEELLAPLGYRYYLLTPKGPVPGERVEGHPSWLNYLFATPGASLLPLP